MRLQRSLHVSACFRTYEAHAIKEAVGDLQRIKESRCYLLCQALLYLVNAHIHTLTCLFHVFVHVCVKVFRGVFGRCVDGTVPEGGG